MVVLLKIYLFDRLTVGRYEEVFRMAFSIMGNFNGVALASKVKDKIAKVPISLIYIER